MKRSTTRILTTHAGSLPYPDDSPPEHDDDLKAAVADVVALQCELGIDLVNEGEYTKGGDWLSFADDRFAGFEITDASGEKPLIAQGKDREQFDAFYRYATERGTLFYTAGGQVSPRRMRWVCTGPIAYAGHEQVGREIEYLYALADALRVEYELIVDAGFVLQVDDAWLPALWDRIGIEMGLDAFRDRCRVRVQALNHALTNIPEDRVRYHMCWGSWHGPHAHDLELVHLVDILLEVKAQAYLIEGANARHEHEWAVWRDVRLPEEKILVPGVVTHSTDVVEHPELVAQRLERFASVVGPENVIAGTDCGFGGRTHPQIAWAKLRSLSEGAARASESLCMTG
jgi:5-methyltetrahydropteroyltriglutamate--homocysteine methyltransferase